MTPLLVVLGRFARVINRELWRVSMECYRSCRK
jgi:hypothetical protein